ncbi:glycosyltransferase [Flavobacterium bizetiae]|uniref:glycosyltransferase n=1 Tax=Flavobacterium bizetiae TaxID=2704140 RepID=UPI003757340D
MKLLIVSTAPVIYKDKIQFAYSPYVKELVVLEKFADEFIFCCPVWRNEKGLLITKIPFTVKKHFKLIDFNLGSFSSFFKAFFFSFYNLAVLFKAMKNANHIHLRCPGNIGLLACLVQVLFPKKIKTAKYAGNWDPQSKQPFSYKLQKWILNNTFLTRNMTVLIYGEWKNQSKNIKPFFTATYSDSEKEIISKTSLNSTIEFIFVGSLVLGKSPIYAIKLVQKLIEKKYNVILNLYGEGPERKNLENYIQINNLEKDIVLHGNKNQEVLKKAYQKSHFVILPSKSEGWPKAIAEGMFWGCVPVASKVSCVPFMLDYGSRGLLLEMNLEKDINMIKEMISDEKIYFTKSRLAIQWSQNYTVDLFEAEIKKLLS